MNTYEISDLAPNTMGSQTFGTKILDPTAVKNTINEIKADGVKHAGGELSGSYAEYHLDPRAIPVYSGLSNMTIAEDSIVMGSQTMAYCLGYKFLSGDYDAKTITLPDGHTFDASVIGKIYSVRAKCSFECAGKILSLSDDNRTAIVDVMPTYQGSPDYKVIAGKKILQADGDSSTESPLNIIYFPFDPTLGDMVIGSSTFVMGEDGSYASRSHAMANGDGVKAIGSHSHAEGLWTVAGYGSHAEGFQTSALCPNGGQAASTCHAEGCQTFAKAMFSHADGRNAIAAHSTSYVWNGNSGVTYTSHGIGTYNVCPISGANGFYLGDETLSSIIAKNTAKSIIYNTITKYLSSYSDVNTVQTIDCAVILSALMEACK